MSISLLMSLQVQSIHLTLTSFKSTQHHQSFKKVYMCFLILTGDSGYAVKPYLMTPFLQVNPGSPEARYNTVHKKTRFQVECAFGDLKNRWRCIHRHGECKITKLVKNNFCMYFKF